jgi:hypothetical protein
MLKGKTKKQGFDGRRQIQSVVMDRADTEAGS